MPNSSNSTRETGPPTSIRKYIGKMPIAVNDGPGFLVNRLLFPYMSEALELLSEGAEVKAVERAAKEMVGVSVNAGGALSGEHGIGSEKRDLMGLVYGPIDLDAQARLREAIDPYQVFNPGKVLPSGSRCYDFDLAGAETSV